MQVNLFLSSKRKPIDRTEAYFAFSHVKLESYGEYAAAKTTGVPGCAFTHHTARR